MAQDPEDPKTENLKRFLEENNLADMAFLFHIE